jgi:ATP-dependent RNA helicase RhlE
LAGQIGDSFADYGKHMGLKHEVIFGGVSQHPQTIALRNGTDILIATPGRLLDLMNQGYIYLDYLEVFVLDEADRMLDMGFIHDVRKVIKELPKQRQTLFFSATMPPEIAKLADMILHNPAKVEVTPVSSTAEKVSQQVYMVDKKNKLPLLLHIINEQKIKRTLVFARTKHGADRVAKDLNKNKVNAGAIHGDKSQNARQAALNAFKEGKLQGLVATDIAARGIDIDSLTHVVNYDLSNVPETYVHRIGRTGRAGAEGMAISFCDREERAYLRDIIKLTKQQIPVVEGHPFQSHGAEIAPTGETKPKQPSRNGRNQNFRSRSQNGGQRSGNHQPRRESQVTS